MQPIPADVLKQFNAAMQEKGLAPSLRADYRKWLLYYNDFRSKYSPPDTRSEQVRVNPILS